MSSFALRVYLQLNLALVSFYLLFRIAEAYLSRARRRPRFRELLSFSRIFLLLSLITPITVSLIPTKRLPRLPAAIMQPLSEVSDALLPTTGPRFRKPLPPPTSSATKQTTWIDWLTSQAHQTDASTLALLSLLALLLTATLRALLALCKSATTLSEILRSGVEIKTIRRVSLIASNDITIPFSTLWKRRKWIVFPLSLVGHAKDYRIAFRHELEHHRQRDTAWAIGIEILIVLFPLNPFVYVWKRKFTELQELSCDESLIGRKRISSHDYGSCLVRVAEAALGSRQMLVGTTCMAADSENPVYFKSFLRRRIEMLVQHKAERPKLRSSFLVGTAVGLFAVVVCYGSQQLFTQKGDPDQINPGTATYDRKVQEIADRAIDEAIRGHEGAYAFAVVADPNSGRILAVANKDNRQAVHPNSHWALSLRSNPASVIKTITVASAVEKGATALDEVHDCENGEYIIDHRVFRDWMPFDHLTTANAVVHSSNICTMKVALRLGAKNLNQALRDFGIGEGGTAEYFPEARPGEVPEIGDLVDVASIGVGFAGLFTTPLEIVQAYGAIANGGNLLEPRANEGLAPKVIRRVLSQENARDMRSVLAEVMIHGTALQSQGKIYRLAGKTGTAWAADSAKKKGYTTVGNFAGFGPAESPRVVAFVGIQDPTVKPMTGSKAAPVFRQIVEEVLQWMQVPPSASKTK